MSADEVLFPGFRQERLRTRETEIHAVVGGQGPPVLLLHGYPQTHACWHRLAPALASRFTVVCPDLRGYGDSGRPPSDPEHRAYAKRAMAQDQADVMGRLGFERFAVVGHDRGGRVAYRLALDRPERVTRLAVLDMVPTLETWARMDRSSALGTYHWLFLAQPADLPERLIGSDPDYFLRWTLRSWAARPDAFDARALAEYQRAFRDPDVVHATCEDYRAGATADLADDAADRDRRRIECPVLALWGARRASGRDWDPVAIWRDWARDVRGQAIPCGHFLPEEAPAETLAALEPFLLAA
ncbi:MAG TPA: alpha/beta hydrolase [Methylomirabilota bacterium]